MTSEQEREQNVRRVSAGVPRERQPPVRSLRALVVRVLRKVRTLQDRLIRLLGSTPESRLSLVAGMLERNPNEATSYWLQLGVSIGIATLGLVIGSVAVIIGAMLVAPLMRPILALAMGLAAGSPFLVLRSAGRIVLSVLVAIGGAALITVLLPFHELNHELASRTSPTALDLLTAGFCALAGVYASLRPGSDTAATAAGTAIGISLVPPLCVSGYGFGTTVWPVAGGAALLFLTNLVAIIFVGTVAFVAAGLNRVNTANIERDELAKDQKALVTGAVSRRLAVLFESRAGPLLRFLMPLVLLAAVYVPLRRALDEVAWEVRVRAAVLGSLEREPRKVVQSRVRVERHQVDLRVVLLGSTADAEASRERLNAEIAEASGVAPRVEVLAIPDAMAFAGLESTLRVSQDPLPLPRPKPPPPSPKEQLEVVQALLRSSVARNWPVATAGEPLAIDIGTSESGPLRVHVAHLGAPLGPAGVEAVTKSLGAELKGDVHLVDVAIPSDVLTRSDGDLKFMSRVSFGVRASAAIGDVNVCVVQSRPPQNRWRVDAREQEFADTLRELLSLHPRVTFEFGDDWQVRFVRETCTASTAADSITNKAAAPPP